MRTSADIDACQHFILAPFYGACDGSPAELLKIRPMSRPKDSLDLPEAFGLENSMIIPARGAFSLPIFKQAICLGQKAMLDSAKAWVVKTPGTLGPEGSWRLDGHRISILQMLGFALYTDPTHQAEMASKSQPIDHAGFAAGLAMESFDWTDELAARDKLLAACSFAYLYTDLTIESCLDRDEPELAEILASARAFSEADLLSIHAKLPSSVAHVSKPKSL